MSSLLKALKQQQSPLVNRGSQLDPQLIDTNGPTSKPWLTALVAVLAITTATLIIVLVFTKPWVTEQQRPEKSENPQDYSLGEPQRVAGIEWEATPEPEQSEPEPEPTVVNQQPQQRDTSSRQPLDLNSVSEDLLAKFEQAVKESSSSGGESQRSSVMPALADLESEFRGQVPEFSYDGHMFVSNRADRWIEFNTQRLYVGDNFQGLTVERIEPQQVVLSLQGKAFTVEALEDWRNEP
ncbi:MAG: general secretion pathway protein GspB [Pseudomonadota bacterium]